MPRAITVVLFLMFFLLSSCKKNPAATITPEEPSGDTLYFPPTSGTEWQTTSPSGWNETNLNNLYEYLDSENTKAFIILKNGKIVAEKYFGTFTADSLWYWASAGKTLTSFLAGIAQQEHLFSVNDLTSKYIGTGWTSETPDEENKITIKNQLTMTTGLDDGVADDDCTSPSCLLYKADAGTRWAYHMAPYTLLGNVIAAASGMSYNNYYDQEVGGVIGMKGLWIQVPNSDDVFYSDARSMARFGLLLLNKGTWSNTAVLTDSAYYKSMVNSSQTFNLSYGYLTWLNGKSSFMVPGLQLVFNGSLIPAAPADMFAALGKNDQKIYVVPSQQLVVIRMGNSAGGFSLAVSGFDNQLWAHLKTIINY